MKTWSQDELDELLACPKRTIEPPKRSMRTEMGSHRNEALLESEDGRHRFRVFIRQNADFAENFSIGLEYHPREEAGSITLLRCNGPHGPHKLWPHHAQYHIHKAKAENLLEGGRAEAFAEITPAYASFEEALRHFGEICHIADWSIHYPPLEQMLFKNLP